MAATFDVLVFSIIILSKIISISSSSSSHAHALGLSHGSFVSVDNKDAILVSLNGLFTAGFHQVGVNAYVFAVWFSEQTTKSSRSRTVVWMANRDTPVNGRYSKLTLREDGSLVLKDAGQYVVWSTHTKSTSTSVKLELHSTGNIVLYAGEQPLWQSFDHPTDTLLPNQPFTKNTKLVSATSSANCSSGFYKLLFDNDSILRLLYDGPETSSVYWPDPRAQSWETRRFQYVYSRRAGLDSYGQFNSSDGLRFESADLGMGPERMMSIDTDGNLRVYSLVEHERRMRWEVQWQAFSQPCLIHGVCGPNSLCTYSPNSGRKCTCLHGYKMVKSQDWSYGCEPEFVPCTQDDCDFIKLPNVQFYGYDVGLIKNCTLDSCKKNCLQDSTCTGFQFQYMKDKRYYSCYKKTALYNGYQLGRTYTMHIKLPKSLVSSFYEKKINQSSFNCPQHMVKPIINRLYKKRHDIKPLGFMMALGYVIGFMEIICIIFCWYKNSNSSATTEQSYFPATTTFRKFTYSELKKTSCNFSEEIGRGGACIVYKGRLSDNRLAAIKRLKNTNHQGEAEFQAEISTIGRVNHMNLIETWGYCAEGKHRLVVYEYMENGSLADILALGKLDWATLFDIAIGTAKGLAYLHDECLEWVLHCDVKPHNILLDANYSPKVADFGLFKLLDRGGINNQWNFSMIRGTRGYMAPEWVFNLPITSKVDVYSYGVVILEMITGRSPTATHQTCHENGVTSNCTLIDWVRDRIQEFDEILIESWVEEIIDPSVSGKYDRRAMENLIRVALQRVEEDREARPSMSQVVDMLLHV